MSRGAVMRLDDGRVAKSRPLMDRLMAAIEYDPNGGCWLWSAATTEFGYGLVGSGRRPARMLRTHRVVWEHRNGPIPPDRIVMHGCDVPQCCNPDHLRLGTKLDNTRDMISKGRAKFRGARCLPK